jgi:hypothetical protein
MWEPFCGHGLPAAFAFILGSRLLLFNTAPLVAAAVIMALLTAVYRQLERQLGSANDIVERFA